MWLVIAFCFSSSPQNDMNKSTYKRDVIHWFILWLVVVVMRYKTERVLGKKPTLKKFSREFSVLRDLTQSLSEERMVRRGHRARHHFVFVSASASNNLSSVSFLYRFSLSNA